MGFRRESMCVSPRASAAGKSTLRSESLLARAGPRRSLQASAPFFLAWYSRSFSSPPDMKRIAAPLSATANGAADDMLETMRRAESSRAKARLVGHDVRRFSREQRQPILPFLLWLTDVWLRTPKAVRAQEQSVLTVTANAL